MEKVLPAHSGASYPEAALPTSVHPEPRRLAALHQDLRGRSWRPLRQVVIKAQLPQRLGNMSSGKRLSALAGQQGHGTQISLWGSHEGLYLGRREAPRTQPQMFPRGFGETEPSLGGSRVEDGRETR